MKNKIKTIMKSMGLILVIMAFLGSCSYEKEDNSIRTSFANRIEQTVAINKCIELCKEELKKNIDLSNGPCLSNNITQNYVCDIAHSPREPVDNIRQNQCSEFGKKRQHFVELDESCNLIRVR